MCKMSRHILVCKYFPFTMFNRLVLQGYRQPLGEKDLWELHPRDVTRTHAPQFQKAWNQELEKTKW